MKREKPKKVNDTRTKSGERRKRKPTSGSERRRVAKGAASSPNEPSYKVRHFALGDIKAKKPSGPIDPEVIERIVEGYRTHGQLMPLTVRVINGVPHLVTGFHRRAAAEKLGLEVVPCNVIRGGKTIAALWKISENRDRKILTVLDQAEQMAEWFGLVEEMNPVPKDAKKHGPGRPEGAKKKAAKYLPIPGKTPAAKQKTLDRLLKIAATEPAAKQAARDAGFADDQKKLLQVAGESTPDAQLNKVITLRGGSGQEQPSKAADETEEADPPLVGLKREWKKAKKLRAAWQNAALEDRRAFIIEDLEYPLDEEPEAEDDEDDDEADE
jgi:hypothetical protein